jgi:hypothetical protein
MKAYCIMTIARQVNGEAVGVRIEKCFTNQEKAQVYINSLAKQVVETVNGVSFSCERGLHELDIIED